MEIGLLYAKLAGPARRALETLGITNVEALCTYTRQVLLDLHGIGPKALSVIEAALRDQGLTLADGPAPAAGAGSPLVDAYIEGFSGEVRAKLEELRALIRAAAPEATEKISYRVPTYALHGNLVHFSGYSRHIGFYPEPSGIASFEAELAGFKHAKGSVQFPLGRPLPADLIQRIVRFRVEENRVAAQSKARK